MELLYCKWVKAIGRLETIIGLWMNRDSLCMQVTALLVELAEMRRQDPGAKAVVFSTWGRLLKLVGEALQANGLQHVSLAGAQPNSRAAALRRFLTDPDCAVILIVLSTGGVFPGPPCTSAVASLEKSPP